MRILKLYGLLALLTTLNLNVCQIPECEAAHKITSEKYYKDINTQNAKINKNYRIILDKNIYSMSQASLNDIRIVLNEEKEVPYEIFTFEEESKFKNIPSKIMQNIVDKDGSNVVTVDLGKTYCKNNKVTLKIADHNFGRRVKVEGSKDALEWHLLTKGKYIYDFTFGGESSPKSGQVKWQRGVDSRYMVDFSYRSSSRDTTIKYKDNVLRYLKITVFKSKDEEPLSIERVEVSSFYGLPAEKSEYECAIKETLINKEHKSSEVMLDFGVKNIPLHSLKFSSPAKNYYRTLYVQGSNDLKSWNPVAKGEIFDYNIENFSDSKKEISFPETKYRYFKLIILNQSNPPIEINFVRGISLNKSVVFPYKTKGSLRIYYGNPYAEKPVYDYSRYVRKADARKFRKLYCGRQLENPLYVPEKPEQPWTEGKSYLLWATLGVIITILLFFVASMLKKI